MPRKEEGGLLWADLNQETKTPAHFREIIRNLWRKESHNRANRFSNMQNKVNSKKVYKRRFSHHQDSFTNNNYTIYSVDTMENPKYRKKWDPGRKAFKVLSWDLKEKGKQGEEWVRTAQHTAKHFSTTTTSQDTYWHLQLHWTLTLLKPVKCAWHKGNKPRATGSFESFIKATVKTPTYSLLKSQVTSQCDAG